MTNEYRNKHWGGARKGAGRKPNPLRSAKLAAELIARGKKLFGDDTAPSPLEYILAQLWNPENSAEIRFKAAEIALPYCSPRLASVNVQHEDDNRLIIQFVDFTQQKGVIVQSAPVQPQFGGWGNSISSEERSE